MVMRTFWENTLTHTKASCILLQGDLGQGYAGFVEGRQSQINGDVFNRHVPHIQCDDHVPVIGMLIHWGIGYAMSV